jgi:hypothetical protein
MAKKPFIRPRSSLLWLTCSVGLISPPGHDAAAAVNEDSYGRLPLYFEANQGQTRADVAFLAHGAGYGLYLTRSEALLVLDKRARETDAAPALLSMRLVHAARRPEVRGLEQQPGRVSYFIGDDPARWRTAIPTYAKVRYREVYPGIDLVYYGKQRELEYDFVVAPGADPRDIVLGYKGAERLEVDAEGELVMRVAGGSVRQRKPSIYQEIDGVRREIGGGYVLKDARRVGFRVDAYDETAPLVIDPVLGYSTYLGGDGYGSESGSAITVDADGNAYVIGTTQSTTFPTTPGAFQKTLPGGGEPGCNCSIFVTKLDPTGTALVYSTYLGGSLSNVGAAIAVDAVGNAYVTGDTWSSNFPTTPGAFQPHPIGDLDGNKGFVTKLDPNGSALVYSTYLGGHASSWGAGIAVDAAGDAYVVGSTQSPDFPTTAEARQPSFGGSYDAFVVKLDPTGSALVYSTYLGGGAGDYGAAIALAADGGAYVTGFTGFVSANDFPATPGAFQTVFGGQVDAFAAKLDSTGSTLLYSTYLGGASYDYGYGLAVDGDGNAYLTGVTSSSDFPATQFPTTAGSGTSVFVTKLDSTGTGLAYSTHFGGSSTEWGTGIAVQGGNAYVTGYTSSSDFPVTPDAFQPANCGGTDAFLAKLDPAATRLVYSTYLGGADTDTARGIEVDAAGFAYLTGNTRSADFPVTPGAFQATRRGASDAFVSRIAEGAGPVAAPSCLPAAPATTPTATSPARRLPEPRDRVGSGRR